MAIFYNRMKLFIFNLKNRPDLFFARRPMSEKLVKKLRMLNLKFHAC